MREAERLGVRTIALADPSAAETARSRFRGQVLSGPAGVAQLAAESGADVVLNAVVGAAGLEATLAALDAGIDVALANKESLVAGGPLVRAALERGSARLLPVDSEHSALQQLLEGEEPGAVEALVVTASGGPFRGCTPADLDAVTPEQALRHPTWTMGARITIDSATLMNKGLEVIEAHWLFDVPFERIEVVVHPQSIVHALVRLRDGAMLAHLGLPDMRVPIAYALAHPRRAALAGPRLDLTQALSLTFEPADGAHVPLPGARARRGRRGRARPVRAERRRRGGRRGLPGRPLPLQRHPGARRARAGDVLRRLAERARASARGGLRGPRVAVHETLRAGVPG